MPSGMLASSFWSGLALQVHRQMLSLPLQVPQESCKSGECARRRGDIAPLHVPTGLEVGATQESMPDETVVVGDASGIGMWNEEQTMSPVLRTSA